MSVKKWTYLSILLFLVVLNATVIPTARSELAIEITKGTSALTSIAVVPFGAEQNLIREDVAQIVRENLARSGVFASFPVKDMLSYPSTTQEVHFRDWQILNVPFVLIGRLKRIPDSLQVAAEYQLFDVVSQKRLLAHRVAVSQRDVRDLALHIADEVYKQLTGFSGMFLSQLAYVVVKQQPDGQALHILRVSDVDGSRERTLLSSRKPILSPDWSPDGQKLAYVTYLDDRSVVKVYELQTGRDYVLSRYAGLNSAPDWSPDGKHIALALSKDGNVEIYTLRVSDKSIQRVTRHYGIDTEPQWMPDGEHVFFTSSRGGKPQIYKKHVNGKKAQRMTYHSNYAAGAQFVPNQDAIVYVHADKGDALFNIAFLDWEHGYLTELSPQSLAEGIAVSPNGRMILYATTVEGKRVLAMTSIDGYVHYVLPIKEAGGIQEPDWSQLRPLNFRWLK